MTRSLGEAFGSEQWPVRARWARERELDMTRYAFELDCDWTSGSFMLARREALLAAGLLDERFFLQCEEPDLCLRIKRAGWRVRHLPSMTILHHGKPGVRPRMVAQEAYARRQYAQKHFSKPYGSAYHRRRRRRTPPARGISARRGRRQARGGPPGAAYARRQDSTSVWRSAANSAAQAENGNESTGVSADRRIPCSARRGDSVHLLGHGVRRPTAADA